MKRDETHIKKKRSRTHKLEFTAPTNHTWEPTGNKLATKFICLTRGELLRNQFGCTKTLDAIFIYVSFSISGFPRLGWTDWTQCAQLSGGCQPGTSSREWKEWRVKVGCGGQRHCHASRRACRIQESTNFARHSHYPAADPSMVKPFPFRATCDKNQGHPSEIMEHCRSLHENVWRD